MFVQHIRKYAEILILDTEIRTINRVKGQTANIDQGLTFRELESNSTYFSKYSVQYYSRSTSVYQSCAKWVAKIITEQNKAEKILSFLPVLQMYKKRDRSFEFNRYTRWELNVSQKLQKLNASYFTGSTTIQHEELNLSKHSLSVWLWRICFGERSHN